MKKSFVALILLLLYLSVSGQTYHKISGYIRDAETGENLIGASVFARDLKIGTYTNNYGFYSLRVPEDSVTITFSYLGYTAVEQTLYPKADQKLNFELSPEGAVIDAVVIEAEGLKEKINSTEMSTSELSAMTAKKLPALFGEVDILKTIQLKPGIQSGSEGSSGLYVRGGGPDQNLFLLDEAVVYNPNHLFGFFSTFNTDAVKGIKLYKGGFPAQYGGRLSSVVDVRLKDGNRKKFSGSGGLGLISSRLTLEGPIQKDKSSFMISGRRTYVDVFTRIINRTQTDNPDFNPIPDYFFSDLNGKLNFDLGENDRLFFSGYWGRDVFNFNSDDFEIGFNWGNITSTARWNHIFGPGLFMNATFTFSDYDYEISNDLDFISFNLTSGIRDVNGKVDFSWLPDNKHTVRFGTEYTYHTFTIGRLNVDSNDDQINFQSGRDYYGTEVGAYVSDDWEVNSRLKVNMGLRLSGFQSQDTFFFGLEPRLSAKYSLSSNVSLKASYARTYQYIHLVSNSGASLPTDIWFPSTGIVNPQLSDQVAAGVSVVLGKEWLLTNELYYKWMQNQVDFRDGANLFANDDLEPEFVFGRGWSYGNEFYIEKTQGKTTGWVGYTWSWTQRRFPDINNNEPFFPRYDRRHDISVVVIQELSKRVSLTGAWIYGTGQAITLPNGYFFGQGAIPGEGGSITGGISGTIIPEFLERNSFRMPAYHRLDLGLVWTFFPKWGEADLTFSVYNAYSRRNPFFIYIDTIDDPSGTGITGFAAKQVSLFPTIPSATFNFKF